MKLFKENILLKEKLEMATKNSQENLGFVNNSQILNTE